MTGSRLGQGTNSIDRTVGVSLSVNGLLNILLQAYDGIGKGARFVQLVAPRTDRQKKKQLHNVPEV